MGRGRHSLDFVDRYGYDLLLGSIAAFYVFMVPYTKVEESFNVQYDHLEFPGVVPRTFIGAILVSILASPLVSMMSLLHLPKIYSLFAVNLAYGNWLKGHFYAALNCLIFATLIFRCDVLLLLCPLGLELLLTKSITLWKALKCCIGTALFCIGLSVLVDTIMWKKFVWPEFQVLWFNSVLNRSSEWGLGVFLDRRVVFYILPVVSFVLLYSKLPHKELRFVISSVPMFNLSAAIAASRMDRGLHGCLYYCIGHIDHLHMRYSKASKESRLQSEKLVYPHVGSLTNNSTEQWVHIDPFSAMNGISRFCEYEFPWRYCKEEGIPIQEFDQMNFTYLLKTSGKYVQGPEFSRRAMICELTNTKRDLSGMTMTVADAAMQLDLIDTVHGTLAAEDYFLKLPETLKDQQTHTVLLIAYVNSEIREKAESIHTQMIIRGYPMMPIQFKVVMILYMNLKEYDKVDLLVSGMRQKNIPLDVDYYNVWLLCFVDQGSVAKVEQVFEQMEQDGTPLIPTGLHFA
ncbi:hypothetical protein RHSIM_Rhsim07G0037600 [Rhododendron simsii]|uniref:Mannosyltransferase n=1 Tax=Rhododendron simsii TaxID=118357 RepID=A0A834LKJ1_RHOSS|nr:hypothetical protein RHSIM_Rhsim07G0037600 [Rhododendron simsii]